MNDEKLDALLEAVAENTTTLIDVQQQAAATSASTKDARTYVQTIAKNTDWEANGEAIGVAINDAVRAELAEFQQSVTSLDTTRLKLHQAMNATTEAAASERGAAQSLSKAAQSLLEAQKTLQAGKWRRWALMALTGALCAALGYIAREPVDHWRVLNDAGRALQEDPSHFDCTFLGGTTVLVDQRPACVIWQDPES